MSTSFYKRGDSRKSQKIFASLQVNRDMFCFSSIYPHPQSFSLTQAGQATVLFISDRSLLYPVPKLFAVSQLLTSVLIGHVKDGECLQTGVQETILTHRHIHHLLQKPYKIIITSITILRLYRFFDVFL